jgi:prepilin-type N-terminal cleavage/methylation domain-containing protein/prepilin-type processing-associated H-X9-DG protein
MKAKAFTLIELLVVIAIIAILAAILFPVFAQAKTAAKKAQDLSNHKQIALGHMMYTADYDDTFCQLQFVQNNPAGYDDIVWHHVVYPYIKSAEKYDATAGIEAKSKGYGGIFTQPSFPVRQHHGPYALHFDVFRDGAAPWCGFQPCAGFAVFSQTQIDGLSEKVMMIERGVNIGAGNWLQFTPWQWDWTGSIRDGSGNITRDGAETSILAGKGDCDLPFNANDWSRSYDGSTWAGCGMLPRYRYNGATNVSMFDGSARTFTRTTTGTSIRWYRNIYIEAASRNGAPY